MADQYYIAILRGINVSGKNKIKMADLKTLLSQNNFEDVQTYIQSGNIVFATTIDDPASQLHLLIKQHYGYEVPVLVKTKDEWQSAIANNPFLLQKEIDATTLHFTFLATQPSQELIDLLGENKNKSDSFAVGESVIYVHCPDGYGKTKFNNNYFERKLKIAATTRNYKTTMKLEQML